MSDERAKAVQALVELSEELGALVSAGQDYDREHRLQENWRRVPDYQAARIVLGAIAKLRELEGK